MKPVFPDARYPSKLFPLTAHMLRIFAQFAAVGLKLGNSFTTMAKAIVVHTKCRFQKQHSVKEKNNGN